MKQQFLNDIAGTIKVTAYNKNIAIVPTSATITLYHPSGSVLQSSASATVNSTTGEMTYSLTSTHTDVADVNYKAVWAYVYSGTTYYISQLFDVVKSILAIPIVDDDLFNELDTLRSTNEQKTGIATSSASSYLIDTTNRKEPDDYWKGGTISIIAGTGSGQQRGIASYTQSNSKITVSPNWTTTPSTDSNYVVVRSYHYKIEESFKEIETMLYNKGKRHQLILESSQIELPLKFLTIHKICLDNMDQENDKWDRLAKLYWEKFTDCFGAMKLEYDEDDSGFIQGDEEQKSTASFTFGRS